MGTQEYKNKVEYGVAAVVLLVGVFFIFQAFTIETSRESVGPRTLPMILAVSLVLGGLWLGLRAFRVVTFWAFGYFVAVIVTLIAMLLTFGVRNWIAMIIGAIVLAIIFQWVFMGVMLLNDPKGAIVDMRPYTNWITGAK